MSNYLSIMRPFVLVTLAVSVFTSNLFAEPELKGSPAELAAYLAGMPMLVSVTGEAEIKVSADRANISLKVVTENRSLQEAVRVNRQLRANILKSLAEHGIPAERILAAKFSSTPQYGWFAEKAKSYRVENIVKIAAQDEREFQAVAGLVDSAPEIHYQGIEFEHSDKDALTTAALGQALDKADERRRLYEGKLGIQLSPRRFVESNVVVTVPAALRRQYAGSKVYSASPLPGERTAGERDALPGSFDELVYAGHVKIEYAVQSERRAESLR
jgi:uncharacterized protein